MYKAIRIFIWVIAWVLFSFIFVDYLPQNAHMPYSVLLSPITFIFEIVDELSYPSKVATGIFSSEFLFGVFFWVIVIFLFFFPRKNVKE